MDLPIYLDYAATTPIDPRVVETLITTLQDKSLFGNPASRTHTYGWLAEQAVDNAREQVAALINAVAEEIVWTSGATESNNLAIKGAMRFHKRSGKHLITIATEHKAVLDPCRQLEKEGFEVTYLRPAKNGLVSLEQLKQAIRPDTVLVSTMFVNNETGVVQDIQAIGDLVKSKGLLYHVDAAQAAGKLPIDLQQLPVDLMSFSGHKVYAPKGVGALFIRQKPRVRIESIIHGGGHELGVRSGTLATHQIFAIGKAFELAKQDMQEEIRRLTGYRAKFWQAIESIGGVHLNGNPDQCVPGILNVSFEGVDGEALTMSLSELAVSSGSACSSGNMQASHVLSAMGIEQPLANSSLRLSIGRFTTEAEIDQAIGILQEHIKKLRNRPSLWGV